MKTAIKLTIALAALTAFCYGYSAVLEKCDLDNMQQSQPLNWGFAKDRVIR
jgi:hypothetical protein